MKDLLNLLYFNRSLLLKNKNQGYFNIKNTKEIIMKIIFIYLFVLLCSYQLHAQTTKNVIEEVNIHNATSEGDLAIVRTFVEGGNDVNLLDSFLQTPLHTVCASVSDHIQRTQELCQGTNFHPDTPFYEQCHLLPSYIQDKQETCPQIISVLVQAGADVNVKSRTNRQPLHLFVTRNEIPLSSIEEIIQKGADVTTSDRFGDTPLHSIFNHPKVQSLPRDNYEIERIINYLLHEGADINAANTFKDTPLDLASLNSTLPIVSHLIERGANVIIAKKSLHNAVSRESFEITSRLLEAGADVSATDPQNRGQTPLHIATNFETPKLDIIFLLIQYGADIHAENENGQTPFLQMAEHGGVQYDRFIRFVELWSNRNSNNIESEPQNNDENEPQSSEQPIYEPPFF